MRVLVTGAAGFLGSRLVEALVQEPPGPTSPELIVAVDRVPCPVMDDRIVRRVGTIDEPAFADDLLRDGVDVVYHLAAVLSGEAESDFDLGFRVNVDATRRILECCRRSAVSPRFVFASTIAVFGGPLPPVVPDDMVLRPQSSYGTEKAIGELLVGEYSRKGFVDGIACRIATVTVRPGRPNSALSSFVSGIIREPMAGERSVCPVPMDTPLWVTAPTTVVANLLHAARVPAESLGVRRALTLPGLTTTPAEMLHSLERHGGTAARALVRCEVDPYVTRVVASWPGAFDVTRARALGFRDDVGIDALVSAYVGETRRRTSEPTEQPAP